MLGIMALICLGMFYASPLSVIFTVIKNKDSTGLDLYFILAALLNSSLWAIYGLFLNDVFLYGPTIFGAFVSIIQLICIISFPKKILDENTQYSKESKNVNEKNMESPEKSTRISKHV